MNYNIDKIAKIETKILPKVKYNIKKLHFENVDIDILISIDSLSDAEKEYFKKITIDENGIEKITYPDYITLSELQNIQDNDYIDISDTIINLDKKTENVNISLQKAIENLSKETKEKSLSKKLIKVDKIIEKNNYKLIKADLKILKALSKGSVIDLKDFISGDYWLGQLEKFGTETLNFLKDSFIDLGKDLAKGAIDYLTNKPYQLSNFENAPVLKSLDNTSYAVSEFGEKNKIENKQVSEKEHEKIVEEEIKQRNHISPIHTLLSSVDFFTNMYTIALKIGDKLSDDFYFVKINGIEIPQPKRNTFQRSACGVTIDIPTSELTIEKVGILSYPVDAALSCYSNYSGLKTLYDIKPFIGFIYDLKNKPVDLYVTYDTLISTLDKNGKKMQFNSDKINAQKTLDNNNTEERFLSKREGRRVFIFRNVRFMSDNSSDLDYTQSSANIFTGQSKFIFRKVEELEFTV